MNGAYENDHGGQHERALLALHSKHDEHADDDAGDRAEDVRHSGADHRAGDAADQIHYVQHDAHPADRQRAVLHANE